MAAAAEVGQQQQQQQQPRLQAALRVMEWAIRSRGALVAPQLELADFDSEGMGLGFRARADVAPQTVLVSVPRTGVMDMASSPLREACAAAQLPAWIGLALTLLHEFGLPPGASPWEPYVQMLLAAPRVSRVAWSAEEAKALQDTSVASPVPFMDEFFLKASPFIVAHPELFAEGWRGWKQYLVAVDVLLSRAVARNEAEEPCLAPVLDFFNTQPSRPNAHVVFGSDALQVVSSGVVPAGSQVFLSYGHHMSNAETLFRYGFITPNNSNDSVAFDTLEIADVLAPRNRHVAEAMDQLPWGRCTLSSARLLPTEMYQTVRVVMEPDELSEIAPDPASQQTSSGREKPWSSLTQREAQLLRRLIRHRQMRLGGLPTSHEEEGKRPEPETQSEKRRRMALAIRATEISILKACADAAEGRCLDNSQQRARTPPFDSHTTAAAAGAKRRRV